MLKQSQPAKPSSNGLSIHLESELLPSCKNRSGHFVRFARKGSRSGRVWVFLLGLVVFPVVAGYVWFKYKGAELYGTGDDSSPILQSVVRGPFDHIVLEQGEIESSSNNEVKCGVKGRGTSGTPIIWVIAEGTLVKKGEPICKLDSSALENDLQSQRIKENAAQATVISSDAAVRQALIARQEYLEGTYLTERKAILSEIAVAQQGLRTAELSLASAERLAAKGTLKPLQIEAEQFAVQNARNTLDAAQGRLRVLDELTKQKMLVQYDSDIETAKAKLESDRSTLAEERDKLTEIQQQIDACNMIAPADGQVVHANKFSGRGGGAEFLVEPGAMVREQQTIILLPDPSKMQVKAKVNESRVALIREGMPVQIQVGTVADDLVGRVIKVNKYAEPGGWMSSSVKEYATFIQILDPPPSIRTGMTAEVRIYVQQLSDALQIPVHAIYETKGHHFVLKPDGKKWMTEEVKIGATNEKYVTITKGLSENDQVVLNPQAFEERMNIPALEEQTDRQRLASAGMGANQAEVVKTGAQTGLGSNGPTGPGAASGGPGAGGPGAGGPGAGGPDPEQIVKQIFGRLDTNSDGKITSEEAAGDERTAGRFQENDKNGDGSIDQAEMLDGLKARMGRRNSERPQGGPPGDRPPLSGPATNPTTVPSVTPTSAAARPATSE